MASNGSMNFETELRRLARRDPFIPYTIILTSGDRFEVTEDWQFAASSEGSAAVYVDRTKGICYFRKNQIVGVSVSEPAK